MRRICYGFLLGAVAMYVYVSHGHFMDSAMNSVVSWRSGAKESVYGYGGHR